MVKHPIGGMIRKAARLLQVEEYEITHAGSEGASMEEAVGFPVDGLCIHQSDYRQAHIIINNDLDRLTTWRTIVHEVSHVKYAQLEHTIEQCWKARPKLTWAQAKRLIQAEFEILAEKDVSMICDNLHISSKLRAK